MRIGVVFPSAPTIVLKPFANLLRTCDEVSGLDADLLPHADALNV